MIRDKLKIYEDNTCLKMKCFSCNKTSHFVSNCPLLQYIPKRKLILDDFIYFQQQRKIYPRRIFDKKENSLKNSKKIHEAYVEIRLKYLKQPNNSNNKIIFKYL